MDPRRIGTNIRQAWAAMTPMLFSALPRSPWGACLTVNTP
jgi:hypothetical protein